MSDCIFCRIAAGEIPATIVKANQEAVAFRDLNPQAPTHLLVIPRHHVASLAAAGTQEEVAAVDGALRLAVEVARQEGLDGPGYRLVTNVGADGGQSVHHLHFHLLGGRRMEWPPG